MSCVTQQVKVQTLLKTRIPQPHPTTAQKQQQQQIIEETTVLQAVNILAVHWTITQTLTT